MTFDAQKQKKRIRCCFAMAIHSIVYIVERDRLICTRVGTLIVATIYLQLIQNRYMFRSFTVLQC